ncbi:MAG: hypothetical protein WKI04_09515 [Ferruginibacter sp.]
MRLNFQNKIHYILRLAVAMCFIGHGIFGIITKAVWCNYFGVFAIGRELSFQLMPLVGFIDIVLGIIMLVYPVRAIPAWLIFWGILTAVLRPLSGEPFAEFIERSGNFGAPLALLLLSGIPTNGRGWFRRIDPFIMPDPTTTANVATCLKLVVFLLLFGHGLLNVIGKESILNQYRSLGSSSPEELALITGLAEITAAFFVLFKPFRPLLLVMFFWKMGSEMLYPHYALFEWIERGGSYGALLALWVITKGYSIPGFVPSREYTLLGNAGDFKT